ncbi:L-serine ammonia-lyase [Pseudahrensia aquimaris]|uniref:L-serine dehydratase n=1 Tax=Pseudahrensia aquimaris TaxID=744461 RepID=A0ABW3FJX1_9HYPH
MFLSVFDMFKVGIGPSSSHTMGPMVAARQFLHFLRDDDWPRPASSEIWRVTCSLHGSLAFTGKGHGTDRAVILGMMGCEPSTIDPDAVDGLLAQAYTERKVLAEGFPAWEFDPDADLIFDYDENLPAHANGMRFSAYDRAGQFLVSKIMYSIGGGFVADDMDMLRLKDDLVPAQYEVPYPFSSAKQMLEMARTSGLTIADMKRENEKAIGFTATLDKDIRGIWDAMDACVKRGLSQEGELPGGLFVKRRAKQVFHKLDEKWSKNDLGPLAANDWLSVFAMAVNEENAAGGKVVTAPTNGAAGVIPAVLSYHLKFHTGATPKDIEDFLLTAAAIGGIIKHNASISGAEVGCQGEVGSAAAMAAAGLAAIMGGTPEQVENAAEIALEHHLGMTCDPVGGLVQVPCIERNALGAVKAVTAASLAMHGDGTHFVPLDACIETMRQTGYDMSERYKETSQGGLAVNMVEC